MRVAVTSSLLATRRKRPEEEVSVLQPYINEDIYSLSTAARRVSYQIEYIIFWTGPSRKKLLGLTKLTVQERSQATRKEESY